MRVKCPLCDFETDDAAILCGHILSTHTEPGSTKFKSDKEEKVVYECKYCGMQFETYEECAEHVARVHMSELEKELEKELEEEDSKKSKKKSKKK